MATKVVFRHLFNTFTLGIHSLFSSRWCPNKEVFRKGAVNREEYVMKQEAKGKNVLDNILMSILVSAYGGYILPPTHIWQMLAWKKNRTSTIDNVVPMHSKKK